MFCGHIKKAYPTASVKAADGVTEMTTGTVGTNSKIHVDGKVHTVVKKGDIDGDGQVTVLDVIQILNHSKKENIITDNIRVQAGLIDADNEVTVLDVIKILNYAKGSGNITLN